MLKWAINTKFIIILKVMVSSGLVVLILNTVDMDSTLLQLRSSSPLFFFVALLVLAIQSLIAAGRWRYVLANLKIRISYLNSVRYLWIGLFFNQTLPSSVGGDVLRGYYLCREGSSVGSATLGVLLDRFFGMVGLVILVIMTLPLLFDHVDDATVQGGMVIIAVGFVGSIIALLSLDLLPSHLSRWRLVRGLFALAREGRKQMLSISTGGGLMVISVVIHLLSIFVVVVLAHGMEIEVNWRGILLVVPVVTLAMTAPVSIAGWGVREGVLVVGLGYFGFASEEALALSVLYGLSMLVMSIPGGIVWLTSGRHTGKEMLGAR